jgi:hypothetical protein
VPVTTPGTGETLRRRRSRRRHLVNVPSPPPR